MGSKKNPPVSKSRKLKYKYYWESDDALRDFKKSPPVSRSRKLKYKYYWENDEAHGEYTYNTATTHSSRKSLVDDKRFPWEPKVKSLVKIQDKGVKSISETKMTWKGQQLSMLFSFIEENLSIPDKPLVCLDIGCNAALNLKKIKEDYPNDKNEYYGFDINSTALKLARDNVPEGNFRKCNFLLENPLETLKDDFFDICFSTWVLTHINVGPNRENLIKDMVRTSIRGILYEPALLTDSTSHICPRTSGDAKNYNVVVHDDYRNYSNFITLVDEGCSTSDIQGCIFYWDKTK